LEKRHGCQKWEYPEKEEKMEDWIQVFRIGRQTDSAGNLREWTPADLDKIASLYDPAQHEAPVVIGHPKENTPAWGRVEALKREGDFLYAKLKNLVPEFVGMIKKGLFKKRSISLYPDLTLRHIGFLGAIPPAVKGLADINFAEEKGTTIEMQLPADGLKLKKEGSYADPGNELAEKAWAIFMDHAAAGPNFQRLKSGISFREAFELACLENLDLAFEYLEYITGRSAQKGKSFGPGAGEKISDLVKKKIGANKALSFSQAFSEVKMENPAMVGDIEFLSFIAGRGQRPIHWTQGPDLPFMAGRIKFIAGAARDLLAADPNLTKIDAIIKVLNDNPDIVRQLTAGGKVLDLSEFAAEIAEKI
jgi:hypothetical protein